MTRKHDIAIIGIAVFPDAKDAQTFGTIFDGHVAIREVIDDRWEFESILLEDRHCPDKTYSKIGGFIGTTFRPKDLSYCPKVVEQMDDVQKLALHIGFPSPRRCGT